MTFSDDSSFFVIDIFFVGVSLLLVLVVLFVRVIMLFVGLGMGIGLGLLLSHRVADYLVMVDRALHVD